MYDDSRARETRSFTIEPRFTSDQSYSTKAPVFARRWFAILASECHPAPAFQFLSSSDESPRLSLAWHFGALRDARRSFVHDFPFLPAWQLPTQRTLPLQQPLIQVRQVWLRMMMKELDWSIARPRAHPPFAFPRVLASWNSTASPADGCGGGLAASGFASRATITSCACMPPMSKKLQSTAPENPLSISC